MRIYLASLLSLIPALFLIGCAGTGTVDTENDNGPRVGSTVYTLCNLHADPTKRTLVSINYVEGLMIPLGTEVTVDSRSGKSMVFTDTATGIQYTWNLTKHTPTSLSENLNRYFGPQENVPDANSFSPKDTEGIRLGKALVGMTKEGVLAAIGPPPEHATPSLTLPAWTYWKNRWTRRVVTFGTDDVVTEVKG